MFEFTGDIQDIYLVIFVAMVMIGIISPVIFCIKILRDIIVHFREKKRIAKEEPDGEK